MSNYQTIVNELIKKCESGNILPSDFGVFASLYGATNILDSSATQHAYDVLALCLSILRLDCRYKSKIKNESSYYSNQISDNSLDFLIHKHYFSAGANDLNIVIDLTEKIIEKQEPPTSFIWRIPLTCINYDVELIDKDIFIKERIPVILQALNNL